MRGLMEQLQSTDVKLFFVLDWVFHNIHFVRKYIISFNFFADKNYSIIEFANLSTDALMNFFAGKHHTMIEADSKIQNLPLSSLIKF